MVPSSIVGPHPPSKFSTASHKAQRKMVTQRVKKKEVAVLRTRLFNLCRNGNFTTWDSIMASDISWPDMIRKLPENVMSFKLNAMSKSLPSPSNLVRWGQRKFARCSLCNMKNATSDHILSNCFVALRQKGTLGDMITFSSQSTRI